jgi:iron complex outermembrane receptor protein
MMKAKLFFFTAILIISTLQAFGYQNAGSALKGKVSDEKGNPLAGAGVSVINTFLGTYSGMDGTYNIKVPGDGIYSLKFSFTGYETVIQEINVTGTGVLNVTLVPKLMMTEEVIVSATRAGNRTPVAYTNVGSETIRQLNNGQDLPFLIGLTPSLVETSEAGAGIGYTSLRIRGTDGSRINVTIDGIPLNDAESQQVFWVDLPDLASSVDNIQVQRGVGTSSNGAGAFGASVNIETKSPDNVAYAEISSIAGSFNTYKNVVKAGTGLLADRFAFQLRFSNLLSDGYIERTGSDNRSAYISGTYRTSRSLLKTNIILGEEHTGISWWGVPAEMLSINRRYNPAGEYEDESGNKKYYDNESDNYKQNHYQLIYTLKLNRYTNFHTALYYTFGEGYYEEYREDQPFSEYGLPSIILDTTEITSTDLIRRKWMSNDFYGMVYSLKFSKEKIDAVFGGGMNVYDGNHYGKIIWMRNAGNAGKDYQWYLNKAHKGEFSMYGKIDYKFSDKISGFGDLQYRHIYYNMYGPDDDLRDISQSHLFNFINPKGGLFFSPGSNQDAYISFSVANKEPTRSDFKDASGDKNATPTSETLFDTEAGYNLRTDKANVGFNLYGMIYKDQLVPTGELSNVGYPIMTNVKRSYRVGLELTAGLKPADRLDWNLNMTISRNKILGFMEYYLDYNTSDWTSQYKNKNLGTVDIAYSPSITGSSNMVFHVSNHVKFHLVSKYVGKQYFDNTMNADRMIDPYLVNNIMIDYSPDIQKIKNADFQLLINNVFNNKYESNGYGGNWYEDGLEKTWSYYFPQAGINFLIRFSLKF